MAEKPKFVIIGEQHPENIAGAWFSDDLPRDAIESYKKILDNIVHREIKILKDEGVTRLFIEVPASKKREQIYSRYSKERDFGRLKPEILKETIQELSRAFYHAKRLIPEMGLGKAMLFFLGERIALGERNLKEARPSEITASSLFMFHFENAAHEAKILDIHPVDDAEYSARGLACLMILDLADLSKMKALAKKAGLESAIEKIEPESISTKKTVKALLSSLDNLREQKMNENILIASGLRKKKGIAAGLFSLKKEPEKKHATSALICGKAHAGHMKALLSQHFEVKQHTVDLDWLKDYLF